MKKLYSLLAFLYILISLSAQVTPGSIVEETIDSFLLTPAENYVREIPVVIIRYMPTNDGVNLDVAQATDYWSLGNITLAALKSNVDNYNQRTKFALEEGSRYHGYKDINVSPFLGYRVIKFLTVYRQIQVSDYLLGNEGGKNLFAPDYNKEFEDLDLTEFINQNNVKEVWLWYGEAARPGWPSYDAGIHGSISKYVTFVESNMSSPTTGDISNSNRISDDLPILNHTYIVYSYNFRRSQAESVHDHGHQLESMYQYVNLQQDGNTKLFWQDFVGRGPVFEAPIGRVGDCHQPPNTKVDYDYLNDTLVESDIEDWKPEGGTNSMVNVNNWGNLVFEWPGDDNFTQRVENQWYIYWMQNMPGKNNRIPYYETGKVLTNWWSFTSDWDYSITNKIGLYNMVTEVSAGGLSDSLAASLDTITSLTLAGTIDSRDFKTMRDSMPMLNEIDLSEVKIVAYSGSNGTSLSEIADYLEDEIPERALSGKNSLISVILPFSCKVINEYSFLVCGNLQHLIIPDSVTHIMGRILQGSDNLVNLNIPPSVIVINNDAFTLSNASIVVDDANPNYSSLNGVLFNKDKTLLMHYPVSRAGVYSVPSTIITIGFRAFCGSNQLTSVTIPSSVDTIFYCAFEGCSKLSEIIIPEGVRYIGESAYAGCSSATGLTLPSTIESLGTTAFSGIENLDFVSISKLDPVDLNSSPNVFYDVDKDVTVLNVPYGSATYYADADQWMDFMNIHEMTGLFPSTSTLTFGYKYSSQRIFLAASEDWMAESDQDWLSISPFSGSGSDSVSFTAESNWLDNSREAIVTFSGYGFESKQVIVIQSSRDSSIVEVQNIDEAPVIDGIMDPVWDYAEEVPITKRFVEEFPTVSANWRALYDDENFYAIVTVQDDDHYPDWKSSGSRWNYDTPDFYWDFNENLKDGLGPIDVNGHYLIEYGFQEGNYGLTLDGILSGSSPGGKYAYTLDGENYTYEIAVPWSNFVDKEGIPMTVDIAKSRMIGFDVTIIDQDEGVTTFRQRKVWQNIGFNEESWTNMNDCGKISFVEYNFPPVANAGSNQTVEEGTLVTLDGTDSFDPNHDPLNYKWIAPAGITLNSDFNSTPVFTAPDVNNDTLFQFTLVVSDGIMESFADTVIINVTNKIIPEDLVIVDQTYDDGNRCFDAFQTITVAGSGPEPEVDLFSGSYITLIAGQSIRFLPGFYAHSGCYMDAYITTDGTFCDGATASQVIKQPEAKSTQNQSVYEIIPTKDVETWVKIYPNPATDFVTFNLKDAIHPAVFELFDLQGRKVLSETITYNKQVSVSHLQRGIYFCKLNQNGNVFNSKIVIE